MDRHVLDTKLLFTQAHAILSCRPSTYPNSTLCSIKRSSLDLRWFGAYSVIVTPTLLRDSSRFTFLAFLVFYPQPRCTTTTTTTTMPPYTRAYRQPTKYVNRPIRPCLYPEYVKLIQTLTSLRYKCLWEWLSLSVSK